jgi:hypothetical protein
MFEPRDSKELAVETLPTPVLAKTLMRRGWRSLTSLLGMSNGLERSVTYNGITVYDRPELDGGGWMHGQDYIRGLLDLGFQQVERICEFCAGPAYIGFSLLANGFCRELTLVDINPAAIAVQQKTVRENHLEKVVKIYQSDCLDQVPRSEQWDIVVSNPPQYLPVEHHDPKNIRAFDPGWTIHQRFYASVKNFMKPGGHTVIEECAVPLAPGRVYKAVPHANIFIQDQNNPDQYSINLDEVPSLRNSNYAVGSTPEIFVPMIEKGGGEFITWRPAINVAGQHDGLYYIVARW